jgi:hypothetical protein
LQWCGDKSRCPAAHEYENKGSWKIGYSDATVKAAYRFGQQNPVYITEMNEAIAAGDGTLHGAINYWQDRALKAEASRGLTREQVLAWLKQQPMEENGMADRLINAAIVCLEAAFKEAGK